jgi:hypothetical protein
MMEILFSKNPWNHAVIHEAFPADLYKDLHDDFSSRFVLSENVNKEGFESSLGKLYHRYYVGDTHALIQTHYLRFDFDDLMESRLQEHFNKKIYPSLVESGLFPIFTHEALSSGKFEERGLGNAFWHFSAVYPGTSYAKHVDTDSKTLSFVCYMIPEKNIGTILYSDEEGRNKTPVEWKPNTAIVFARGENTWHDYHNPSTTEYRVTLQFNLAKAPKEPYKNDDATVARLNKSQQDQY